MRIVYLRGNSPDYSILGEKYLRWLVALYVAYTNFDQHVFFPGKTGSFCFSQDRLVSTNNIPGHVIFVCYFGDLCLPPSSSCSFHFPDLQFGDPPPPTPPLPRSLTTGTVHVLVCTAGATVVPLAPHVHPASKVMCKIIPCAAY